MRKRLTILGILLIGLMALLWWRSDEYMGEGPTVTATEVPKGEAPPGADQAPPPTEAPTGEARPRADQEPPPTEAPTGEARPRADQEPPPTESADQEPPPTESADQAPPPTESAELLPYPWAAPTHQPAPGFVDPYRGDVRDVTPGGEAVLSEPKPAGPGQPELE